MRQAAETSERIELIMTVSYYERILKQIKAVFMDGYLNF